MDHLAGRSDTMVKLRGVNVWPEAIGTILEETMGRHVEYFCVAYRRRERDEMLVLAELPPGVPGVAQEAPGGRVATVLNARLGVALGVRFVQQGELAAFTGQGSAAKLRRFKDERKVEHSEIAAKFAAI
jgi:phenylacetate-CoA ligase